MRIFSDTEETFLMLCLGGAAMVSQHTGRWGWFFCGVGGCDGIAAYGTEGDGVFFVGLGAAMVSQHTGQRGRFFVGLGLRWYRSIRDSGGRFFCGVGGCDGIAAYRTVGGGWGCSLQDGIWFNSGVVSPKKDAINQYNTVLCLTCVFVLCLCIL